MPPIPSTPASRLLARSLRLPGRLLARRQAPRARLAARVTERRRPHVARIGRRLSRAPLRAEPVFAPEGMSDFASRWIFGDGPAEGTPLGDSEARAALARAAGPPSFQSDASGTDDGPAWPPIEVASSASLARTPVEEFGARRAGSFRLSSSPAAAPVPPPGPPGPPVERAAADAEAQPSRPTSSESALAAQAPPTAEPAVGPEPSEPAAIVAPGPAGAAPAGGTPAPAGGTPAPAGGTPAPAVHRAPVRATVSRSARRGTPAPAAARPAAAPMRVVAAPPRAPSAAALAAQAQPRDAAAAALPAATRPGILRRALTAAGGALARRRVPAPAAAGPPPGEQAVPHGSTPVRTPGAPAVEVQAPTTPMSPGVARGASPPPPA
ncbi:MAG: hypothetical protein QOH00_3548, partial [Gaiellales bacterium]|nr:hypothetical protein [Gaiellales bacterium]